MKKWLWAALALAACESGMSRQVEVSVSAEIANGFTASAPGVVVSDLGADAGRSYTLLCGQTSQNKLTLEQDLGFGCIPKAQEGTTESVRVWVQPMPGSWDAAALCAARTDRSFYESTSFAPKDAGSADGGVEDVAPTPDPSWVQGSATGTWHRDGSPCGGALDAKVTLAKP